MTTNPTPAARPVNPCTHGEGFCGQHGYDCPPTAVVSSAVAQSAPAETALPDRIAEVLDECRTLIPTAQADAVMAVLRGLTLRELELLHRPDTPPSRPEPHRMAAVELLRRTESYLSALHGSVARHDNLAANLGCAGCELRDQVGAELRRMADETQPAEAEAHPPYHRWYVETLDGLAGEWAPGMRFTDRDEAAERYRGVSEGYPTWKDGAPVQRRFVRETTSYTVETGPAVGAQPPKES